MTREKELKDLHETICSCTLCPLHETRTIAVPGEGSLNAKLFFVGEAPGAREDETGRPFVGRSGKLLTSMIEELGLLREDVFITSILHCRPPNNRAPTQSEREICRPYIEKQIELISPRVVVLLGGTAISSMVGPWKVTESHGSFFEAQGRTYFMTFHPAAALRSTGVKELMRADFKILQSDLL
ncbi:MAG: uracil-DNA glycosylase [Candidatus Thorarchaeota archaeon]|nr:MAG: uracil-DNA glycosylase [Candidatus Thorarchaeota archaeon]